MSETNPNDFNQPDELVENSRIPDDDLLEAHTNTFSKSEGNGQGNLVIPILTTAIVTLILVFGGNYIRNYSADFNPWVYDENGIPPNLDPVAEGEVVRSLDGEKLYKRNCVACHQSDGKGLPGAFPPLVGSPWVRGDPERMVAIVLNGLTGRIEVAGNTYNSIMTPFSALLNDEEIAAITTFIRSNPDWGNNADRVSAEQVAATRASYERSEAWKVEEILELFPLE